MRTRKQKRQQAEKTRMPGCVTLMQCLRQMDPHVQFDRGVSFFTYTGAVGSTLAGLALLAARRAGSREVLAVSLLLWLAVLAGNALVLVFGTSDRVEEEAPGAASQGPARKPALPHEVEKALARAMGAPRAWELQAFNSVELPGGQRWEVSLERKDHDDSQG